MSPDEVIRKAAQLLRSGVCPVQEFVEALDDATRRSLKWAVMRLPDTLRSRENAARVSEGAVPCVRPGGRGTKIHALVRRRWGGRRWGGRLPACGALGAADQFMGTPTCASCLKSLASGRVTP